MIAYQRQTIVTNQDYFFKTKIDESSKVTTKVGEIVYPESIIAHGWQRSGFRVFNLSEMFGIDSRHKGGLLKRTVGSRVYKGDLLASHRQWFGLREKIFRSPAAGILLDYNPETTKLTIQYLPTETKITASAYGRVVKIQPSKYIRIGTKVDIIKGSVAFGTQREGSLMEVGYPDIPIQSDQISSKHENKIIFGGTMISLEALYKALSLKVKAVITGAIDYEEFTRLVGSKGRQEDVGISLLVTEGFGQMSIYSPIYDFLKQSEHRHTILTPRCESLVVPVSSEMIAKKDLPSKIKKRRKFPSYGAVKIDRKVRLLSDENFGSYGIVSKVDKSAGQIEVTTQQGTILTFPDSIEIINDEMLE